MLFHFFFTELFAGAFRKLLVLFGPVQSCANKLHHQLVQYLKVFLEELKITAITLFF